MKVVVTFMPLLIFNKAGELGWFSLFQHVDLHFPFYAIMQWKSEEIKRHFTNMFKNKQ